VCCSVLQCVAGRCRALQCVAVILQCVAGEPSFDMFKFRSKFGDRCVASILQCVAICCSVLLFVTSVSQCVASVLRCVAVCCGVLQCVAVETPLYIATSIGKLICVLPVCCSGCSWLQLVVEGCSVLHCVACETLHNTITCNTLPHIVTHCNKPQHWSDFNKVLQAITHCNVLQQTATHCNTLQHTVTHCNTLYHRSDFTEVFCKMQRTTTH